MIAFCIGNSYIKKQDTYFKIDIDIDIDIEAKK